VQSALLQKIFRPLLDIAPFTSGNRGERKILTLGLSQQTTQRILQLFIGNVMIHPFAGQVKNQRLLVRRAAAGFVV
jgi:hypothetical protein